MQRSVVILCRFGSRRTAEAGAAAELRLPARASLPGEQCLVWLLQLATPCTRRSISNKAVYSRRAARCVVWHDSCMSRQSTTMLLAAHTQQLISLLFALGRSAAQYSLSFVLISCSCAAEVQMLAYFLHIDLLQARLEAYSCLRSGLQLLLQQMCTASPILPAAYGAQVTALATAGSHVADQLNVSARLNKLEVHG